MVQQKLILIVKIAKILKMEPQSAENAVHATAMVAIAESATTTARLQKTCQRIMLRKKVKLRKKHPSRALTLTVRQALWHPLTQQKKQKQL
jgi:2-methylaconitate cis-trans-isomerase PrpF